MAAEQYLETKDSVQAPDEMESMNATHLQS